jgi:hypothetical protein
LLQGQLGNPAADDPQRSGLRDTTRGEPVSGDRVIHFATAAVVCAVAGFAAVVSYSHIYGLGRAHGQDGMAARLLPLSVDGLILAASLVLLHEARNGRDAPGLARFMLWLGIGATIGANIAYGAGYGLLGAVISAWPAVAFIGTVEIAMQLVRRHAGHARPRACQTCRGMGAGGPDSVRGLGRGGSAVEPAGPWPTGSACPAAGSASSSPASPSRATAICRPGRRHDHELVRDRPRLLRAVAAAVV